MLRDRLRAHTRAQHERIEARLDLPESIRTRDDYARVLSLLYGFHAPLEAALLLHEPALAKVGVELSDRRKAHKARADLQFLGVDPTAIWFEFCADLPAIPTWRHAIGSLYVIEGSTLGGQVIARHLGEHLRLQSDLHLGFFSAYGSRTGMMWRNFVTALNALDLAPESAADVLQGAQETFESLEGWISARR